MFSIPSLWDSMLIEASSREKVRAQEVVLVAEKMGLLDHEPVEVFCSTQIEACISCVPTRFTCVFKKDNHGIQ